ncbi:MAG: hypothetical protein R2815_08085 [Flavobacteriales bacterium]|nr:hypothetical protein [Flavobacteriales bacterium]
MAALRFHWDFFGPDALRTAEHFLVHLDRFCAMEGVVHYTHWTTVLRSGASATLECDEAHLALIRDRLRPRRAERVLE